MVELVFAVRSTSVSAAIHSEVPFFFANDGRVTKNAAPLSTHNNGHRRVATTTRMMCVVFTLLMDPQRLVVLPYNQGNNYQPTCARGVEGFGRIFGVTAQEKVIVSKFKRLLSLSPF